jgi:hypothetical protein
MPNKLHRPCCTVAAHQATSKQLACSTSQGEGGSCPRSDWSDTHRRNQAPHKSGVRSKPHEGAAVLNSAAAALHASDETVVQMQVATHNSRGDNPHGILFYPISPIPSCVSERLLSAGKLWGFRACVIRNNNGPAFGVRSAVGTPEDRDRVRVAHVVSI